jgi:hypothetical protein
MTKDACQNGAGRVPILPKEDTVRILSGFVIRLFAAGVMVGCAGAATSPQSNRGGPPVTLDTRYVASMDGPSNAPVYRLRIRSTIVNVQNATVFLHQWCDQQFGGDTTFFPWAVLIRDSSDNVPVGYQYGGCYLASSGVSAAPTRALRPGDSLTTEFVFPAILNHPPTSRDSVELTGRMHLQYIITSDAGPLSASTPLVAWAFRTSPPFAVSLP